MLLDYISTLVDLLYSWTALVRRFLGLIPHPASFPETVDYIVIGGGTAGCVLGGRLSEDRDMDVLILEAGESDRFNLFSIKPGAFFRLFRSIVDWSFETEPEKGMANRRVSVLIFSC